MPQDQGDHLLAGLCSLWIEKIRKASEHKKRAFGDDAAEAMEFYKPKDGNYNFVYRGDQSSSKGIGLDAPEPSMKMTLNKVAELVEIFGPILYAKNPIRQVNPRIPAEVPPDVLADPQVLTALLPGLDPRLLSDPTAIPQIVQAVLQQDARSNNVDVLKSKLVESYLNFTPNELRLKDHAERAIDEALIKGRGCLWTEPYTPPQSPFRMVGSFFDSVDFLQIDPDAETFEDAWWIARECCHPVWQVEREFGLKPGSLKGKIESQNMGVEIDVAKKEMDRKRGLTSDLCVYYRIYSRMGAGGRLAGSDQDRIGHSLLPGDLGSIAKVIDPLAGDYVYLVIAPGCEYPLNLPPNVQALPITGDGSPQDGAMAIKQKLAWPVPFWADGTWPVSVLDFHPVPRCAWPMSHIKPAMGELRFLCWAYSFVAGKIKNTLRDIVAVLKEMAEEFKLTVLEGTDLSIVELDTQNRDIKECVQVLQFPQMNADIWKVIEAVETNFEKRVGLNEIFYGKQTTQDRSATESNLKSQNQNIRPDDMSERVESWMTEAARKEAVAARLLLGPADVTPILGPTAGTLWAALVVARDLSVFRELEYRIEAGSTRKPNRDRDADNANQSVQLLLPLLQQHAAQTGDVSQINALIAYWGKTRDINPAPFLLKPPLLPPPPGGGPGPGGGAPQPGGGGQQPPAAPPPKPAGGPS